MENELGIVKSVAETIIDNNVDTTIDFFEVGLDSLLDDSLIKDLPLVKTVYGIAKTGFAIREKVLLKKTLSFIIALNSNDVSNEEYQKYTEELKNSDKIRMRELEFALMLIDKYIEERKTIILANLYYNYVCKNITWDEFQELSIIMNNILIKDLSELQNIYIKGEITKKQIKDSISFKRLETQNLVKKIETSERNDDGSISEYYYEYDYEITSLGINLIRYGMKDF